MLCLSMKNYPDIRCCSVQSLKVQHCWNLNPTLCRWWLKTQSPLYAHAHTHTHVYIHTYTYIVIDLLLLDVCHIPSTLRYFQLIDPGWDHFLSKWIQSLRKIAVPRCFRPLCWNWIGIPDATTSQSQWPQDYLTFSGVSIPRNLPFYLL